MAVYIKPPKGNIKFTKLCDFIKKRLLFLHFLKGKSKDEITQGIIQNSLASNSDCLIEGTNKDRISHFVLRCLCVGHHDMESFFIQTETQYFQYRLEFYDLPEILNIVNSAAKECLQVLQLQHIIKPFKRVLCDFLNVASEIDLAIQNKSCMNIPFTVAPKFVQERTYPLNSGLIEVPLNCVKHLLTLIFEEVIYQGLQQMRFSPLFHELKDPRMHFMHKEVKKWLCAQKVFSSVTLEKKAVLERTLSAESNKFPLCMKNLYQILRRNHRLPHSLRVQFILFLKEIGVPLQEVIALFTKEYSFPVAENGNKNNCSHSWDTDKHRYIYSIEHLYGNRGSRKNYNAHGCKSLQSFTNCNSDGGCPFVSLENEPCGKDSKPCLFEVEDMEDLKHLTCKKRYNDACQLYIFKSINKTTVLRKKQNLINCSTLSSFNCNITDTNSCFNDSNSKEIGLTVDTVSKDLVFNSVISKPSDVFFLLSSLRERTHTM